MLVVDMVVRYFYVRIVLPIFETKPPFNVLPTPRDIDAERISFPTTNGLTLRGSLYRHHDPRGLIVFCPELDSDHWSAMTYCEGLYAAGFDILSFDFRSQGDSDRLPGYEPLHWLTEWEIDDVLAALDFVRQRLDLRDLPVGMLGISRGSGAALVATAMRNDIRCVACEGAFSSDLLMLHFVLRWAKVYMPEWMVRLCPVWHMRLTLYWVRKLSQSRRGCRYILLEKYLPRLRNRPVQFIVGERDNYVPPQIGQELARQIGPNCRGVFRVPKAKHNQARLVNRDGYDRLLIDLFSEALSPGRLKQPVAAGRVSPIH